MFLRLKVDFCKSEEDFRELGSARIYKLSEDSRDYCCFLGNYNGEYRKNFIWNFNNKDRNFWDLVFIGLLNTIGADNLENVEQEKRKLYESKNSKEN